MKPDSFVALVDGTYVTMTTDTIPKPSDDDEGCGVQTLLKYVAPEHLDGFRKYVNAYIASADYAFDSSFVGFISDYIAFASILNRKVKLHGLGPPWDKKRQPPPLTIYDVGCAGALQHLVFDPRIHYVGIDIGGGPEPEFFRPNCRFVKGRFSQVVESLNINRYYSIGIANMSLLYYRADDDALGVFDRTFNQKIVL